MAMWTIQEKHGSRVASDTTEAEYPVYTHRQNERLEGKGEAVVVVCRRFIPSEGKEETKEEREREDYVCATITDGTALFYGWHAVPLV